MEGAPLTFGALRPTVVLSPGLDGEALDCVLAHEGVHAARRDNLWHYATALALVVHWWNPAVWLMSRLLRRDIELSCDRAALKRLGEDRRADYAQALVSLATQGSGPAFCQTFGRKAAEERILSIMKFKKTSIIGVIFTLSLVLAVTVTFASEPKTDDGTIQFHGQTFQRDQLSQETLDWLDWYLALPEEQQLAVSYIPAELNPGSASGVRDAYDNVKTGSSIVSVPDIEATKGIQSDFTEVEPDDVDLSLIKEKYAQMAADGKLTQEEADAAMAAAEDMLEQARRGELKLFMTGDGWVYGMGVSTMYYKDENGDLHPISPDTTDSGYVLDLRDVNEYDVELPIFDEDGNSVSADGGIVGRVDSRIYGYELVTGSDAASGGLVGSAEAGDAVPVPSAGPNPITAQPLVYSTNTSCGVAGCTETRLHQHQGDQCVLANPECPVQGCTQIMAHQHNGRWHCFMHYVCPVQGCTITGDHIHDGVVYGCNGAGHSSGVCDGSCHLDNQTSTTSAAVSTHHSESHHKGGHH